MNKISELLKTNKVLVSDGAWGTMLQDKGLQAGECPELWNIEHRDKVLEVAKAYIAAGADMIETNSFGGSKFKLSGYGLGNMVSEINTDAAAISREAAGANKIVLGSVGPTGKILMMGDVTEEELFSAFKEQAMALERGGVDAILVETMSDLDEAKLAIKVASEHTNCEVICTMTFEKTGEQEYRTMFGISPTQMAEEVVAAGVKIIGANCGNGIKDMLGIVKEIRAINKEIPILIHANAGMPIYEDGKTIFPESPDEMGTHITKLMDAGATIIGGCCGTTPEHIRKIAEIVKGVF